MFDVHFAETLQTAGENFSSSKTRAEVTLLDHACLQGNQQINCFSCLWTKLILFVLFRRVIIFALLPGSFALANLANHTSFITSSGGVMGMGTDEQGQLGQGKVYDRLNPVLSNFGVRKIATSSYNTLFLMWDGTVWACGNNYYNTIQAGSDTGSVKKPIQAKFADGTVITDVVDVVAGDGNVFYVLKDGTVWAVGKNSTGALGDGTTTNRNVPVQVKNADGTYFTNVISADSRRSGAGGNHVVYLKSDGTVWACGRNNEGQLGDGTTTNRRNPVQVIYANGTPMTNAVGVSAGEYHSCMSLAMVVRGPPAKMHMSS